MDLGTSVLQCHSNLTFI